LTSKYKQKLDVKHFSQYNYTVFIYQFSFFFISFFCPTFSFSPPPLLLSSGQPPSGQPPSSATHSLSLTIVRPATAVHNSESLSHRRLSSYLTTTSDLHHPCRLLQLHAHHHDFSPPPQSFPRRPPSHPLPSLPPKSERAEWG